MVNTMVPRYVMQTCQQMMDLAVPRIQEEVKKNVKTLITSAARVVQTCNGWTSRATELYVYNYVTPHLKLYMFCRHGHCTRAIRSVTSRSYWKLCRKYGNLKGKDPAIVTDNASYMTIAAQLASMVHVKCFTHTVRLIWFHNMQCNSSLGRVGHVISFFTRSTTASHVLRQKQKLIQLPEQKPMTDDGMLQWFLEQQPTICAALLTAEVGKIVNEVCTLGSSK